MKVKDLIKSLEELPQESEFHCKFFYHFSKNFKLIFLPKANIVVMKRDNSINNAIKNEIKSQIK